MGFKPQALCLHGTDKSADMQHGLFSLGHDLDLRSNFKVNLFGSTYISFDMA